MNRLTRLEIAFRRNALSRGGDSFIESLRLKTGIAASRSDFVGPEMSLCIELAIKVSSKIPGASYSYENDILSSLPFKIPPFNHFQWSHNLSHTQAEEIVNSMPSDHTRVIIALGNRFAFSLEMSYADVVKNAFDLVSFDGDTIFIFDKPLSLLWSLDQEVDDITHERVYAMFLPG